jgi:hypothetical protein
LGLRKRRARDQAFCLALPCTLAQTGGPSEGLHRKKERKQKRLWSGLRAPRLSAIPPHHLAETRMSETTAAVRAIERAPVGIGSREIAPLDATCFVCEKPPVRSTFALAEVGAPRLGVCLPTCGLPFGENHVLRYQWRPRRKSVSHMAPGRRCVVMDASVA